MIVASNLSKTFKVGGEELLALDKANIEIHLGEFIGIYGVSGSGKTTLLNLIGLLDNPTHGDLLIDGKSVIDMNLDEKNALRNSYFGYLHQSFGLLNDFTVYENIEMPLLLRNFSEEAKSKIINEILTRLSIQEKSDTFPYLLSGGQRQRVALARSLVVQPSVILTDEPTGALDTHTGLTIVKLLKDIAHDSKLHPAVVMVTHDTSFENHFDRTLTMEEGKLSEVSK